MVKGKDKYLSSSKALARRAVQRAVTSKAAFDALDEACRHQHYTFPTLSIRQAQILLVLIGEGLASSLTVDGKYVSSDEWIELIKTLVDVRT